MSTSWTRSWVCVPYAYRRSVPSGSSFTVTATARTCLRRTAFLPLPAASYQEECESPDPDSDSVVRRTGDMFIPRPRPVAVSADPAQAIGVEEAVTSVGLVAAIPPEVDSVGTREAADIVNVRC